MPATPWIVLKFGGTSVSSPESWAQIAARIRALSPTHHVWVTISALSQVSNRLERCINAAIHGSTLESLARIEDDHHALCAALKLGTVPEVESLLRDLRGLLEGIRLTGEASPRLRARVMSFGELASTRLGVAALRSLGVVATWVDAREILVSAPADGPDAYLHAHIPTVVAPERAPDAPIVLTQGFIARNPRRQTVLLGRGGSDTSAALFGAWLSAERVEIWTDVHGMFTANPHEIPTARLLQRLGYREAQELAAMGAKVLHPRCLIPVAATQIPLEIHNTFAPAAPCTRVDPAQTSDPAVTAVVRRTGVTLITLSTLQMWGVSGFLAKAFAPFAALGISVDLVATSQSALSVTLDHIPEGVDGQPFARLLEKLGHLGEVAVIHNCGVVSIVGRKIRAVLHELGGAMTVFRAHKVHLVSESSEDLNLSFVVDAADAPRLTARLHGVLFKPQGADPRLGPTWEQLARKQRPVAQTYDRWWTHRIDALQAACPHGARYVYDLSVVRAQAHALVHTLTALDQIYYAIKANPHPEILQTVTAAGLGLECVSAAELHRVRAVVGDVPVLFTPNFCPLEEYAAAFTSGAEVTIDGPDVLSQAPALFAGTEVALRIDPGQGYGHHKKVITAGAQAKFGHPIHALHEVLEVASQLNIKITGLHAHVGSGILNPSAWSHTGQIMVTALTELPDVRWIDLGGGLGVVERPGQSPLDLAALNTSLRSIHSLLPPGIKLRMEPGRFLVSEAGVLVSRVTQVRQKGAVRFVGLATGMNSLIRPALYGAWHGIHNLSRPHEPATSYAHVVGPICETGDILGRDRLLPRTHPGDLLLIENAGAYGRAMASHYNDRAPAEVVILDAPRQAQ